LFKCENGIRVSIPTQLKNFMGQQREKGGGFRVILSAVSELYLSTNRCTSGLSLKPILKFTVNINVNNKIYLRVV